MAEVVELDANDSLTVEEVFVRARRELLKDVIIVGQNDAGAMVLVFSDMSPREAFWALSQAAQEILSG